MEKELRPLFLKMYSEIKNVDDYWLFCATWGKYFPSVAKQGILYSMEEPQTVGKTIVVVLMQTIFSLFFLTEQTKLNGCLIIQADHLLIL